MSEGGPSAVELYRLYARRRVDAAIRAGKFLPREAEAAERLAHEDPAAFEAELAARPVILRFDEIGSDEDAPAPAIEMGPFPESELAVELMRSAQAIRDMAATLSPEDYGEGPGETMRVVVLSQRIELKGKPPLEAGTRLRVHADTADALIAKELATSDALDRASAARAWARRFYDAALQRAAVIGRRVSQGLPGLQAPKARGRPQGTRMYGRDEWLDLRRRARAMSSGPRAPSQDEMCKRIARLTGAPMPRSTYRDLNEAYPEPPNR